MTVEQYFERMKALGYPRPCLSIWLHADGRWDGSAGYQGTCGHGGRAGLVFATLDDMVGELFQHVTNGGQRFLRSPP